MVDNPQFLREDRRVVCCSDQPGRLHHEPASGEFSISIFQFSGSGHFHAIRDLLFCPWISIFPLTNHNLVPPRRMRLLSKNSLTSVVEYSYCGLTKVPSNYSSKAILFNHKFLPLIIAVHFPLLYRVGSELYAFDRFKEHFYCLCLTIEPKS